MSDFVVLKILTISVQVFTILIHLLGVYLLRRLFTKGDVDLQYVLIFNLSLMEMFTTTALLVEVIVDLKTEIGRQHEFRRQFFFYFSIASFTIFSLYIATNMIFITVEKALEVRLNIRHSIFCNVRKAKCLEVMTLFISFGLCAGVLVAFHVGYRNFVVDFATYIVPTYHMIFIVSVVVSAIFIISTFNKNADLSSTNTKKTSIAITYCFKTFRYSQFFIPSCLIFTFFLFNVIPDLILFYRVMSGSDIFQRDLYAAIRFLLYTISFSCHAYIYIFLDKNVKLLLNDQLRTLSCQNSNEGDNYSVSTKITEVGKVVNFQDMAMDLQVI